MKKLVSLILVLLLTFSLIAMVGCSDSNQDAQDNDTPSNSTPDDTSPDGNTPDDGAEITQETLLASKPNEYVPEKLAAGMEVTIAFNPASMDGIGTPQDQLLQAYAEEKGIECYISMEERMACGIGACLACVCQSKEVDGHSHVHNKRVCKDGPVFLSTEVEL